MLKTDGNRQKRLQAKAETDRFLNSVRAGKHVTQAESARRALARHEQFLRENGANMTKEARRILERAIEDCKRVAAGQEIARRVETGAEYV